jgi:hypothetical protein
MAGRHHDIEEICSRIVVVALPATSSEGARAARASCGALVVIDSRQNSRRWAS